VRSFIDCVGEKNHRDVSPYPVKIHIHQIRKRGRPIDFVPKRGVIISTAAYRDCIIGGMRKVVSPVVKLRDDSE
jgi:hypothetical protein